MLASAPAFLERLHWAFKFGLLKAIRREDGDTFF
jgi:hypothetical protein